MWQYYHVAAGHRADMTPTLQTQIVSWASLPVVAWAFLPVADEPGRKRASAFTKCEVCRTQPDRPLPSVKDGQECPSCRLVAQQVEANPPLSGKDGQECPSYGVSGMLGIVCVTAVGLRKGSRWRLAWR